jgi:hypothetical protein
MSTDWQSVENDLQRAWDELAIGKCSGEVCRKLDALVSGIIHCICLHGNIRQNVDTPDTGICHEDFMIFTTSFLNIYQNTKLSYPTNLLESLHTVVELGKDRESERLFDLEWKRLIDWDDDIRKRADSVEAYEKALADNLHSGASPAERTYFSWRIRTRSMMSDQRFLTSATPRERVEQLAEYWQKEISGRLQGRSKELLNELVREVAKCLHLQYEISNPIRKCSLIVSAESLANFHLALDATEKSLGRGWQEKTIFTDLIEILEQHLDERVA